MLARRRQEPVLTSEAPPRRPIRSFVRREGRITRAQQRALDELWPDLGLEPGSGYFDWGEVFGRRAPVTCEIGFGDGGALLQMAADDPDSDFVGVEVYRPGVGALLLRLEEAGLRNVRVAMVDAVDFLRDCVAPGSLDRLLVFFPDPWPKKRHHKRRLIQPAFVELAASRLVPGGRLHCATDWEDYAHWMMQVLEGCPALENTAGSGQFAPRPAYRPRTKYERRGEGLGHGTWDLVYRRPESGDRAPHL
ncbi:MAG TPA: tRNA (guanosine(46)-N7)-methyltransferase TrmB [Arenicellales bacterium]|nr:tRNA (guanosine(46)-N7)-methyltransferase TrmB [Arenicellales bacterium]